jgi:hypothetical protein
MLAARLIPAVFVLLALPVCAQENTLPNAPHSINGVAPVAAIQPAIQPVIQPVRPQPERIRVADKKFWTLTAYDFAMTQIDIATTMLSLNSRTHYCKETFSAAFVGERPSRTKLQVVGLASNTGFSLLGYWLKKRGSGKWWIPQMTSGTMHAGAAAWNHYGSGCY